MIQSLSLTFLRFPPLAFAFSRSLRRSNRTLLRLLLLLVNLAGLAGNLLLQRTGKGILF